MQEKKAKKLLQEVKETYNKIAEEFSHSRHFITSDFEIFKPYLKTTKKKEPLQIVDLGCGNGRLLKFLEKYSQNFDYIGIDNSENILEEARKNYPNKFIIGDQLNIPLPNESVDLLFNIRAFHHIPSKKLQLQALKEMKRVMKNNGILILTVWNLWNKKQLKHLIKGIFRSIGTLGKYGYNDIFIPWGKEKEARYYHAFKGSELKKLFERSGLDILKIYNDKVFSAEDKDKNRDIAIIAQKKLHFPEKDCFQSSSERRIKILDIPFDNLRLIEILQICNAKLFNKQDKNPLFIATPNPEILLEAQRNLPFKKVLERTDLNIPDGFGVILASRVMGKPLYRRITGTDLLQEICKNAPKGTKIFLLGAEEGVAKKVQEILEKRYKNITIVGSYSGSPSVLEEKFIREKINISKAEILFVAYGAPKQELWLAKNLPHLSSIKIAMGVGGAFDFIAGIRKRAPEWMQKSGLEWLYRVIQEPKRFKRIFNATLKFPLVFISSAFRKKK